MFKNISTATRKLWSLPKAFLVILVIGGVMLFLHTPFYSSYNLVNLLTSNSIFLILAMGETIVLISGGVDLSIGGTMTVGGIVAILLINANVPIPIAVILVLIMGAVIGVINAYISVYQETEPFIVTLGMGVALTGLAQQLTDYRPVSCNNPNFEVLANYKLFGQIPVLAIVMIVVVIVMDWILRNTSFGRNCYAIGGDYDVAKYSGIAVKRTKSLTYVISGITAAFGGVMLSSTLNSGNSIYGSITALYVVCALVVGGTSVAGGIGGAVGSVIGILLLGLVSNVFNLIHVDTFLPYSSSALQGVIIVFIVWLDSYGRKRKREAV
jgi:ribose/xylose/arabinose/galactoside ABC-type transport system permease subunit